MTARLQSFMSDYLHKRGVSDGYDFATDAAAALSKAMKTEAWDVMAIAAVLHGVRTQLFRRNPNVDKSKLLRGLSIKLAKASFDAPENKGPAMADKCRILFLAANPAQTDPLQIDEEFRSIQQKIAASKYSDRVELNVGMAVRPDDLLQRLNETDPHVLHFSGHGSSTAGIALSGSDGDEVAFLSDDAIDRLFTAMKGRIRLVVLNACYSEDQAKAIARHIDCVVGMTDTIDDDSAAVFAASLYRALGFGKSVQNAFDQATAAIAMEGLNGADTPVLFGRAGVSPNSVVLVS